MRALVLDDHALFAEGMRALLASNPRMGAVDAFCDSQAAWDAAASDESPGLFLLDYYMPGFNAPDYIARLKARFPTIRIAVITSSLRREDEQAARAAGADLFLTKHAQPEALFKKIDALIAGVEIDAERNAPAPAEAALASAGLSARQIEVLTGLCEGLSNKELARRMNVSTETIKSHVAELCRRISARNRADAVHWAHRNGIC